MSATEHPSLLLEHVYSDLDLIGGTLLDAADSPTTDNEQRWSDLGDWLLLADRVKADRVFFLKDDPVLVFSSLPSGSGEHDVFDCYRRTWSLARPRCLFLAVGDELRVYSLANPPASLGIDRVPPEPLEVVTRAADVAEQLAAFHRERLESGAAFEDGQMAEQWGRADQQLLRDVRAATDALTAASLEPRIAHSLIERAILVRYLEDREILTDEYFDVVVSRHLHLLDDFTTEQSRPDFGKHSRFIEFLSDKALTYDLFDQLAKDFNGDLFVTRTEERESVTTDQLQLLRDLLQGNTGSSQQPLFLWAYDFSVIPTDLISNMYEFFYREAVSEEKSSTYYTPPALVEFVLSDVLDGQTLDREPTVCDPACGSGIFLVDAYRRIVRHEMQREGRCLSGDRLRELLVSRVSGCDIDDAAIRLAAFSLYVAFLSYQTPQDIQQAGPLPKLIHRSDSSSRTAPLVVGDAFSSMRQESLPIDQVESNTAEALPWPLHSFDVVVGNPPWTEIGGEIATRAEEWALRRKRVIGDRNPSQLFLWRALDLLKDGGVAALLIGAKAMLNTRSTSRQFREQWLQQVKMEHVVNFSRVRRDFFKSAVAPFMLIRFRRADQQSNAMVIYETAQPVTLGRRGSAALARLDRQVVPQASLLARAYLWKTYSAGSVRDDAFLARLEVEDRLSKWTSDYPQGFGFQRPDKRQQGHEIPQSIGKLPILAKFDSWGPLKREWFEPAPSRVKSLPDESIFTGRRLLVRWGVSPKFGPHARLEANPVAFRHTTYAISLEQLSVLQSKLILATLLSSLGRYWLYMVSGSWGTWRDQVRIGDVLNLPVRLTSSNDDAIRRIEEAVDHLHRMSPQRRRGLAYTIPPDMRRIDEAVADLFELTEAERSLVTDFWLAQQPSATWPLVEVDSSAGTEDDLDVGDQSGIWPYLRVLVTAWNRRLRGEGEFAWRVWRDPSSGVVAVVLETRAVGQEDTFAVEDKEYRGWSTVLRRLGVQWDAARTQSILRYGVVRVVTDTAIVVIKRDERRLWTATAAWQDSDATAAQLMSVTRS